MFVEHPSILITDDDPNFRETVSGVLQPRGYRTLLASNGEEAVDIVRAAEVHLVLLDNNMPKLTGLETLRLVKEVRSLLPCILLSARLDEALRDAALRANAFSVLSKPVSCGDITSAVARALRETYGWKN
jgi:CheY-like chemotaxis protein